MIFLLNDDFKGPLQGPPLGSPSACAQLYCGAFQRLDEEWLAAHATYMEFPVVMA